MAPIGLPWLCASSVPYRYFSVPDSGALSVAIMGKQLALPLLLNALPRGPRNSMWRRSTLELNLVQFSAAMSSQ